MSPKIRLKIRIDRIKPAKIIIHLVPTKIEGNMFCSTELIRRLQIDSVRLIINSQLEVILNQATDAWGIKVTRVELKNIQPPREIEVMTKQMRAERERRQTVLEAQAHQEAVVSRAKGDKEAKVLAAEAEKEAKIAIAEGQARSIKLVYERAARAVTQSVRGGSSAGGGEIGRAHV